MAGSPDQAAAAMQRWIDAGAEPIRLQFLDLADLDHLDLIAEQVAPQLE